MAIVVLLATAPAQVVRTLEGEDCAPWAKVEVLEDAKTRFPSEDYLDATAHKEFEQFGGGVVKAFGSKRPSPRLSLLHYAPEPEVLTHETPVLLVHGVGTDATLTWYAKNIGGEGGLAPDLVARGHRVFALTFAVSHGDGISHAVHIAHALERVREVTGQGRVDVVAHSKGGLDARAFLVRLDKRIPRSKVEVRRLVLVATPNAGLDLSFRHPRAYTWFGSYGFPNPWTREAHKDVTASSLFGKAYLGHLQMSADLRGLHPLGQVEERARETYTGSAFEGAECPGIAAAVKAGGGFMKRLNTKCLPRGVAVYLLAGTDDQMRYYDHQGQPRVQTGEYDGPSDGLVFVASALARGVFTKRSARVVEEKTLHVPHFELTYAEEAKAVIRAWLE